MPESRHGYLTVNEGIHIAYQWFFLDEADRLAKTDFVATDVGKMARQEDDDSLWLLVNITPTWSPVTGATRLGGLADVDLDIPASDGQVLGYNETYDVWQPMGMADFIGTYALDDLDDVDAATPADGQVLAYQTSSGRWVSTPQSYGFLGDGDWLYQGDENDVGQSWYVTNTWLHRIFNYGGTYLLDGADGVGKIRSLIQAGGADSDVILYQGGTGRLQTETDGVTVFGTLYADDLLVSGESVSFSTHTHDDRYYTEAEADSLFAPLTHSHLWADLTDPPETATRWPAWGEVTEKPTTFDPSAHDHPWSDITSGIPAFAERWPTWEEVTSKPVTFAYTDAANVFSADQRLNGILTVYSADAFNQGVIVNMYSDGLLRAAEITGGRARGTEAVPLAVTSGDATAIFRGSGWSGTAFYRSAGFRTIVDGAVTTTSVPQAVAILAGTNSNPAERVRITSGGLVGINVIPTSQLHVNTNAVGTVGILVDTPASPTANLLELRANTTPLFWVEADGDVFTRKAYPYYIMDMASATDRATILFRQLSGSYQPYNSINAYGTTYGDSALDGKLEMKSSWGVVINTNGAPQFEIGLSGQIKVNQAVATSASTDQPSATAPYRLPIYNMAGTFLGYIPIYSTWS